MMRRTGKSKPCVWRWQGRLWRCIAELMESALSPYSVVAISAAHSLFVLKSYIQTFLDQLCCNFGCAPRIRPAARAQLLFFKSLLSFRSANMAAEQDGAIQRLKFVFKCLHQALRR
jgi:hypothetical protein